MDNLSRFEEADFEDPLSDYEPPEYSSEMEWALAEETVESITSGPFLQIRPTATIRQAVQVMSGSRSASLLVVDDGKVVGIFTERDVLEKVAEQFPKLANHPVSDVMTADPAVVYQTDPAAAAVASIAVAGHRHVPVVGIDDCVIGVINPRRVFEFVEKHFAS